MKKLTAQTTFFCLILACLIPFGTAAQQKNTALKALYFNLPFKLGKTEYRYQAYGLHSVWGKGLVVGIDRERYRNTPGNLPADYSVGTITLLNIPVTSQLPQAETRYTSITAGYRKALSRNTWLTVEAGPSLIKKEYYQFTKSTPSSGTIYDPWTTFFNDLFGITATNANYTYEKTTRNQTGATFRSSFQWAFTNFSAIHLGVHGNFTGKESRFGAYFSIAIGLQGTGPRKTNKPG